MPKTHPWSPGKPHWEQIPEPASTQCREDYEERAAIMEYHSGMSRGCAEQAAYSFPFVDNPDSISAFVSDGQIASQPLRAKIIRSGGPIYSQEEWELRNNRRA